VGGKGRVLAGVRTKNATNWIQSQKFKPLLFVELVVLGTGVTLI